MGRYLKNTQLRGGSYAVQLPIGTSSLGPDAPVNGQIRYNQTNSKVELFINGAWNQVAKIGTVPVVVDEFTGDDSTTMFIMSQSELNDTDVFVTIGGVYQQPTVNYSVVGFQINFTSAPPSPTAISPNKIVVIHNLNSTNAA